MSTPKIIRRHLLVVTALFIAACGGGGGGINIGGQNFAGGNGSGGGIGGTGISRGGITGFGSVWVNGVKFNTDQATITLNGESVSQDKLRLGMIATVEGNLKSATAARLTIDEAVKGRIEAVDAKAGTITVMGQTIVMDATTLFGNSTANSLVINDWVEVHGHIVSDGRLAGSYIEKMPVPAVAKFAIKGFVKNHDPAGRNFQIGNLSVAYAAAEASDLPSGIWNGLALQVKGSACAATPVCGTMAADKVELNDLALAPLAEVELEGFVSGIDSTSFKLGGQTVSFNAQTLFEGGVLGDVVLGTKLEVEGTVNAGILVARKVSLRDGLRLEANVAGVTGTSLSLEGFSGLVINTSALTRFSGDYSELTDIAKTHHVEIRGRLGSDGALVAGEIKGVKSTPEPSVRIRGPVSAASDPQLTVLGQSIQVLAATQLRNAAGQILSRSTFFSQLKISQPVSIKGNLQVGGFAWEEISLED